MHKKLTGNYRFKSVKRIFRKPIIILQVEEETYSRVYVFEHQSYITNHTITWRNATMEDLSINMFKKENNDSN